MPVRIAVCDDAPSDIRQLKAALLAYDPLFEIDTYTDAHALPEDLADFERAPDIVFLDIFMPGTDGIETARRIRAAGNDPKIVFLSSSSDYNPKAFEVFAFNYLLKPPDPERLHAVLDRALDEIRKADRFKIHIRYKSASRSVDVRDIDYVESRDKLLLFHLNDGRVLRRYGRLETLAANCPRTAFSAVIKATWSIWPAFPNWGKTPFGWAKR